MCSVRLGVAPGAVGFRSPGSNAWTRAVHSAAPDGDPRLVAETGCVVAATPVGLVGSAAVKGFAALASRSTAATLKTAVPFRYTVTS
jgi:hypothetical protein